jgi:hypothetical protein
MPLGSKGYGTYKWDSAKGDWVKKIPQSGIITERSKLAAENERVGDEEEIARLNRKTSLLQAKQAWEEAYKKQYELANTGSQKMA